MPTPNDITYVVRSADKLRPNTSPEVKTIYFYWVLVSSSVIKHPDPFLPLSPNIKSVPLYYPAIKIAGYSNHGSYLKPCNTTRNQPSTSLYKLCDHKSTVI